MPFAKAQETHIPRTDQAQLVRGYLKGLSSTLQLEEEEPADVESTFLDSPFFLSGH